MVLAFVSDQHNAIAALEKASADIARAVDAAVPRIASGGRLVYAGAGTSGRLGLLDSVELYPTFSWPKDRAIALLAGGPPAIYQAIEGAEDSRERGAADIEAADVTDKDVVILLAASGTTPYVQGAMQAAQAVGALTIGIANNPDAPVTAQAEIGITLDTGSEVISGSTRLKAGTSQKIVLNTLSSCIMVRLNKVYGNLMVDLKATNIKLEKRAARLTMTATGCDQATAESTLAACGMHVKVAIVAILNAQTVDDARDALSVSEGSVRRALKAKT
jgi:N-acetylmuramic acid 6-phosphate etherase